MACEAQCRFCLGNNLLVDSPILSGELFFVLGSIDPMVPLAAMIVPHRHSETPFEFTAEEWVAFGQTLLQVRALFADRNPDGYTLGWNVGAVASQEVFHAHLHVIPRFKGEPNEGVGIRRIMRTPEWPTTT